MKIFQKNIFLVFYFLFFVALTSSAFAGVFSSGGVKKAQEFIDVGRDNDAITTLNNWTNQNPKDFDAYWMCANLHIKKGNYNSAAEQFGYALKLRSGKQKEVVEMFKIAFKREVANGNIISARNLAQKVVGFDPSHKQQVYTVFYDKGRNSSDSLAVDSFDAALGFATVQADYEKIGKNFLKIALENNQFGYLTERATKILGKDFVDRVVPHQGNMTLFSNTYADANLGADGKVVILDFTKTPLAPGDILYVYPSGPSDSGKTVIYHNDGVQVEILTNGNLKCTFIKGDNLSSGNVKMSFPRGHGISVKVEVVKIIDKKADYKLLSGL